MKKEELKRLYREKILPHNKAPYHFEKIEGASEEILAYNPTCGDKFTLYLEEEKETLKSAHFHGFGCAISKASSSILLQQIEGKSKEEIIKLCHSFIEALEKPESIPFDDEALNILVELKNFEGRIDCVKLSWESLLKHLQED
ncbi:MAG: Fe-S cluster assembly sulfur transfer protein SufU [Bacteroidota bacterium]